MTNTSFNLENGIFLPFSPEATGVGIPGQFTTWSTDNKIGPAGTPSGALLDQLTGFSSTGILQRTGAGAYSITPVGTLQNSSAIGFSSANQALWLVGAYTGSGPAPYAEVSIADTASHTTTGTPLVGWRVDHSMNAGLGAGNRTAIQAVLTQNAQTPGTDGNFKFYTAIFGQTYVNVNDGGISGTPQGNYYGLSGICQLQSGATFTTGAVGAELNISVQSGASTAYKSCLSLISVNSDAVNGSVHTSMLVFAADNTTTARFPLGVSFGRQDSSWPFNTASTIIGTSTPASGSMVANIGMDFSAITFSAFAIKTPGFTVDPSGAISGGQLATKGSNSGFAVFPRGASGQAYQVYNPSGTSLNIFNGTRDIAVFDNNNDGSFSIVGVIRPGTFTVSTLPTAGTAGRHAYVTDGGAALAWGATVTGSGTAKYLVWDNGTNWTVVGK